MATDRRSARATAVALVAISLAVYGRMLVGGQTFASEHYLLHVLPEQRFAAAALTGGHLPLWWDGVGLGVPFAAILDRAAFYPPGWLAAVLPMPWAVDLLVVLHLVLAGLGVSALCRRLGGDAVAAGIAGALFMLGGVATACALRGPTVYALAWLPWAGLGGAVIADLGVAKGRALALAGLGLAVCLAMVLLAGDVELAAAALVLSLVVAMVRAPARGVAAGVVVAAAVAAVALAAVALLPAITAGVVAPRSAFAGLSPLRGLELVFPELAGQVDAPAFDLRRWFGHAGGVAPVSVYLGAPVVIAALSVALTPGLRRLAAAALALVAVALVGPGLAGALAGTVGAMLAAGAVLVAVLAGVGASTMAAGASRRTALAVTVAAVVVAVPALVARIAEQPLVARATGVRLRPALAAVAVEQTIDACVLAALFTAVVAVAVWLCRRPGQRALAAPLLAVGLCGSLAIEVGRVAPLGDRDELAGRPALLAGVAEASGDGPRPRLLRPQIMAGDWQADDRRGRVEYLVATAAGATPTASGVEQLRSGDPGEDRRWQRLWLAASGVGERLLDLFAVDQAIVPATVAGALGVEPLASHGEWVRMDNAVRRPRAFVAARWRWVDGDDALIADLFPSAPDQRRGLDHGEVRLSGQGDPSPPSAGPQPTPPCALHSPRPEEVALDCTSSSEGYAVLLDSAAPGWTVELDDRPATIERAELVARAVKVPAGAHHLAFHYQAPGLAVGGLISLLAWLNLILAGFLARRAPRPPRGNPERQASGEFKAR